MGEMTRKRTHAGDLIRDAYLEPLGLTATAAAKALGVTRVALSRIVNEQAGISAEMALRLAKVFGSTPEFWLRFQAQYDLQQAEKAAKVKLKKLRRVEAA